MFEKRKLKKFKTKIENQSDKNYIEQIYLSAPDYIKNDNEVSEMLFNKNKSLLKILPLNFQLDKLKFADLETILSLGSREAQIQFLKNNPYESSVISAYINNAPEVMIEYVLSDKSILNNPTLHPESKRQLLDLIAKNNLLKEIINAKELSNDKELIKKILEKDNNLLHEVSSEYRLDFFEEHIPLTQLETFDYINLFKYLTEQEKLTMFFYIIDKKGNLVQKTELIMLINCMNNKSQKKVALKNLNYLKFCNKEVQFDIFNQDNNVIRYLDEEIKKVVIKSNPNLLHQIKNTSRNSTSFNTSFKELEELSYDDLNVADIIDSPIFSAKGSLLCIEDPIYDMLSGINQYCESQHKFYQNMPEHQLARLCMQDVNYILPVAGVRNKEQIEIIKNKVKNIFGILYGQEILNKYSTTIDIILNNYNCDCLTNTTCILDLLKIVFNKEIIKNNDVNLINRYVQSTLNGTPDEKVFKQFIENAYGKNASDILNSRQNLNEHNINSLEIFNPIILEKFGVGLVHDLISYNISNMSYFLSIAKKTERLDSLSELYQLESNIYGANITTFQRTLNDFVNIEKLLANIGNQEMTDIELENLYSVIITRNYGSISTKEELNHYENKVKISLLNEIKEIEDIEYIKEKICNAIFGINYNRGNNYERLQMSAQECSNLYENSNAYNSDILTKSEIAMMDFLSVITHETSKENLISILNNLFAEQAILGNYDFVRAISKMRNNQEKLLNDNLITIEKLEKELENNSGLVLKTNRSGIPIYILNGVDFGVLYHNIGGGTNNEYIKNMKKENSLKQLETFEEQYGSSTISTWYESNNLINKKQAESLQLFSNCTIGYSSVPKGSIVGMDKNATSNDISTDHASKLATSFTSGAINFDRMQQNSYKPQEVSFYRKLRDETHITNENHGGRFDFDYFCGHIYIEDISNIDELELMLNGDGFDLYKEAEIRKKPIILINKYAYSKDKQNIQEENLERGMSV